MPNNLTSGAIVGIAGGAFVFATMAMYAGVKIYKMQVNLNDDADAGDADAGNPDAAGNQYTPLETAIFANNLADVESLIAKRVDVNHPDDNGKTPIYYALRKANANNNNNNIVIFLLNNGVDIDADLGHGVTPLMYASKENNVELVEFILSKNANVNAQMEDGKTALMFACQNGNYNIVTSLILKGADITIRDSKNRTALTHTIIGFESFTYYTIGTEKYNNLSHILQMLIDNSADVNDTTYYGVTYLSILALKGFIEPFKILLAAPTIDVNKLDSTNTSIIMRLCMRNNINKPEGMAEIIFELLNKGANVSQENLEYLKANYPNSYNYIKQTMVLLFTTPMIHPDATTDGVPIGPTRTAEFDIKNTPMHQLDTNFIPELNAYFAGGKKGKIVKKRKTKKYNKINKYNLTK